MQQRRRFKQTSSLEARLQAEGERLRLLAASLPGGEERERLIEKIREIEMSFHVIEWVGSTGLQKPS
jgi:hypothetical protein